MRVDKSVVGNADIVRIPHRYGWEILRDSEEIEERKVQTPAAMSKSQLHPRQLPVLGGALVAGQRAFGGAKSRPRGSYEL